MKAKSVTENLNEIRIADKGMYVDEEYMEDVMTSLIHGNMGFFGGVGEEGQVRDAFEERIMDDPELTKTFSDGLKRHVPARMMASRLYKMMVAKGLANYGDVLENVNEDSKSFYDQKPFGNNPGQADVDRQNAQKARRFDGEEYWEEVAGAMGGTLGDLEAGDDYRLIRIMHPEFGGIDIDQDWSRDGSPTKPVTKVDTRQDNENLGRFAIWDNATDYAEDIMGVVQKIADDYIEESGVTGMNL